MERNYEGIHFLSWLPVLYPLFEDKGCAHSDLRVAKMSEACHLLREEGNKRFRVIAFRLFHQNPFLGARLGLLMLGLLPFSYDSSFSASSGFKEVLCQLLMALTVKNEFPQYF